MREHGSRPATKNFDALLCFTLYAANDAFLRAYSSRLKPFGMSYLQYIVLLSLWREGAQNAGTIAGRLGIDRAILGPEFDRLAELGFVVREGETDPWVSLTEEGIALEGAVYDVQQEIACEAGMTGETLDFIRSELAAMMQRMRAAPSHRA